jgi:hypothetical protein
VKIIDHAEAKYKRKKEDEPKKPQQVNSYVAKEGGEEKYETKIYSISPGSGKLFHI